MIKPSLRNLALLTLGLIVAITAFSCSVKMVFAAPANPEIPLPAINFGVEAAKEPQEVAVTLQIMLLLTILSLAPAILIMMTSFMRIVIVLSFVRNALGTQQIPPNQVIVGLALFLTFFVMSPIFIQINNRAIQPYMSGNISQQEALQKTTEPLRKFMLRQTREKDLSLFVHLSKMPRPKNSKDVPTFVLIPAFIISELKTAFIMGFLIYIPFLVIDMVMASVLMSMGMMMLPPIMISLPLKLLLFVLVDGWHLIARSLVMGFR